MWQSSRLQQDSLPLYGSRTNICWVHSWGPKFQFNYSPLQTSGPKAPCSYQVVVNTILEQENRNHVESTAREMKNLTISSVTFSWHKNICPCCRNRSCHCIYISSTHVDYTYTCTRVIVTGSPLGNTPPLPRRVRLYDCPSASYIVVSTA